MALKKSEKNGIQMKNKYIQNDFGSCVHVCLCNVFNTSKFLDKFEETSDGLNYKETSEEVEKYTKDWEVPQFIDLLLYLPTPTQEYIPVFNWDEEKFPNNTYMIFLVATKSSDTTRHCILVIKKNNDEPLYVLDPYEEDSVKMTQEEFFKAHKVYSVEVFRSKETTGISYFPEDWFNHLKSTKGQLV